jgi:hypothetical protein
MIVNNEYINTTNIPKPDKLGIAAEILQIAVCMKDNKIIKWEGNEESSIVEISTEDYQIVEAEFSRLQAEYDAKQYQRDRAPEYPTMQEQLDMQYWDAINGTTTWQDAINAVKSKYPKPTES